MTFGQMKAMALKRLSDRAGTSYTVEDLELAVNDGARYVQKKLSEMNRRVNVVSDYCDVEADRDPPVYPLPQDILHEIEVTYNGDRLPKVEPGRGKTGYYLDGMNLVLSFQPTEDISGGLEVKHSAAISMTDDGDIPMLPVDLHMAIVIAAERILLPTTGESSKEQRAELNELLGDLRLYHKAEDGDNPTVRPIGLSKRAYGATR